MTDNPAIAKYEVTAVAKRRPSALSWTTFWLGVLVTGGLWTLFAAAATGDISDNSDLLWPEPWVSIAGVFMLIGIFGLIPVIVLAIIAGVRGGRSRVLAMIAGFLLLTPLVFLLGASIISSIVNP
ncbi:MAG TPA: hypothetical protein VHZ81_06955 [Galbitalea sp.]|nr:hypothetical protein [Galbitalea sp.]